MLKTNSRILLPLYLLREMKACDLDRRLLDFEAHHGYPAGDETSLQEWMAVTQDMEDLVWALYRCVEGGGRIGVYLAACAARRALPFYEKAYPGDLRPRKEVDLVDAWLRDPEMVSVARLEESATACETLLSLQLDFGHDSYYAVLTAYFALRAACYQPTAWRREFVGRAQASVADGLQAAGHIRSRELLEAEDQRQDLFNFLVPVSVPA